MAEDEVLLLNKTLYGLFQAARVWLRTLIRFLVTHCGFIQSRADPCLLVKLDENRKLVVVLIIYVDDCLIVGKLHDVAFAISQIKRRFNIKELGSLKEYVGASFRRTTNGFEIRQQQLVESMKKQFDIKAGGSWATPAAPGQVLLAGKEKDLLGTQQVQEYRSGVGKLLYLVKLTRPDLASAVRELSKFMDGATMEHYLAMKRVLEFAVATAGSYLQLQPSPEQRGELVAYSDSNYASDKGNRKSVSGMAIYYCGTLIGWRSKAQQCTTLSSTEAEYVACSQAATELEFVRQILESMGVNVQLPMTVYVDNTGAIELARNWSTSGRTKHIDVRFHYLRKLVEQGMMELKFVRSENNTADIFTKNLPTNLFQQHVSSLGVELDPQ